MEALAHGLDPMESARSLNWVSRPTPEGKSIAAVAFLLFCAHFVAYGLFASYGEFSYLRGSAIGIDIDGVLNERREKFYKMAATKPGKHIRPEDIKVLPVHENASLSE